MEARYHRGEKGLGPKSRQRKRVAGACGKQGQEGKLRATVAVAKGVNCVKLGEEVRRCQSK